MSSFVHLHNHSHYSLLDGAARIDDLISVTKEFGLGAVALTDHGNMFGAAEFYTKCMSAGVQPVIGMEAYQAIGSRNERGEAGDRSRAGYYHLTLLVKNPVGYRNLCKLSTLAYLEGFYYKPRIDRELLKEYHEGLVCLSGCLRGEVPQLLLNNHIKEARAAAEFYRELFGDDFYLELQDHGIEEQAIVRKRIIALSRDMDIPLVASNDEHYIRKEHAASQEISICISSGKLLSDTTRLKFSTQEMYYKSPDEMLSLFYDVPEAVENTALVAEKCNFHWEMGKLYLPNFPLPPGETDLDKYLATLTHEKLALRYAKITPELQKRVDYELGIIKRMGFSGYFLIVKDFIDHARSLDIPVGPGRGSAAGSLVSYCLGITNLDPIQYGLIFERFLNPERLSMPDIDIDFCYERRDEIMEYVVKKYGQDNVAQIITFGSMKARAVIRDVGRVLDIKYEEMDRIAKLVPAGPGVSLDDAIKDVPELKAIEDDTSGRYSGLMLHARRLEGMARHASTHAAGIVISPTPLTDYLPLYQSRATKTGGSEVMTQFSMTYVEKIGLLKMDFLGLRTLTVMHHTCRELRQRGVDIDLDTIPLDDPVTYDLFGRGDTVGVFQFESSGMREYLRQLKPNCLEDLIAMNALYRPGPMDLIDDFIDRKHGKKKVTYLHPVLEPILKETYGIIVYQEQVIRIASEMGGFSLGQGDLLRRAMGKKKEKEMDAQRTNFIEGAVAKGVSQSIAEEVFNLINKFAGYGFNKSHAAAYALVAFQTAYLKATYPAEFMASLLTSEMGTTDRVMVLVDACRRMGLEILPPDINESDYGFTVIKDKIRFGLGAVKNVGRAAIESIVGAREKAGPYTTIFDIGNQVELRLVNKRVFESLIEVGALEALVGTRRSQMDGVEMAMAWGAEQQRRRNMNQTNIFGDGDDNIPGQQPTLAPMEDFTTVEKLNRERELLGFYVTGHPLDQYRPELRAFPSVTLSRLNDMRERSIVWVGGIVTEFKKIPIRGNREMAFVTLEDFTGKGEIVVFSDELQQFTDLLQTDQSILVKGEISRRNREDAKVKCTKVVPLEKAWNVLRAKLHVTLEPQNMDMPVLQNIVKVISKRKGESEIELEVINKPGEQLVFDVRKFRVKTSRKLVQDLQKLVGESNAWCERA